MKKINRKGFTLIELMIVIAIIAILAAILVPNFVRARAQGQLTACQSNLKNIGTACEMYAADHNGRYPGAYPADLEAAGTSGVGGAYMQHVPLCPLVQADGTAYFYDHTTNPDWYGLQCTAGNHMAANVSAVGYPMYDSAIGLICPKADGPANQITTWEKPTT
jgi:prepilin-type N-terminal cleavage/methylation domain-containing protein